MKRPVRLTVISIILLVQGALVAWGIFLSLSRPQARWIIESQGGSFWLEMSLSFGFVLVLVGSGVNLLGGKKWARFLYLGGAGLAMLISFALHGTTLLQVPTVLIYATFLLLLFSPPVDTYLERAAREESDA